MGKFFNDNVKNSKSTIVKVAIIGVCAVLIIIILIVINNKSSKPRANIKLYNNLDININDKTPEKLDFFSEFDNYDENDVIITFPDNFTTSKVGSYDVIITIDGKDYTTIVNIIDDIEPDFEVKDYEIDYGKRYYPEDFVESCTDNSNEPCSIDYYDLSKDQDGNLIDYSSYTEPGNYLIKLVAKDENGNSTEPKSVNLLIKDENGDDKPIDKPTQPIECKYGDLSINTEIYNFPLAVIVGDEQNSCALNRDLWDDDETQQPAKDKFDKDLTKLKSDFEKIYETKYPNGAQTYIYQDFKAVYNTENKGLVGYGIYVKLYATATGVSMEQNNTDNLIAEYYIKQDGTREYINNPYNIE
ncbi:MAG: hypothetical protein PUD07_04730 [bacterium]|nr:hypothetical protein [bacterium]